MVISIAITAVLWAIDENQNVLAALVRKVLLVGFFAWLVTQWHSLVLLDRGQRLRRAQG